VKTFIIILVTAAVTVAVLLGIGAAVSSRQKNGEPATKVRMEKPVRGDLVEVVSAPGRVEAKTKVSISARVSARIVDLPFKSGDRVTKGDSTTTTPKEGSLLVRLDSSDLDAALHSAQANRAAQAADLDKAESDLAGAQATLDGLAATLRQAEQDCDRQDKLLGRGVVSQSTFDDALCKRDELRAQKRASEHTVQSQQRNLQALHHRLEAADALIAQAAEQVANTIIRSPIDGVVTRINAAVGEMAMTGTMNNPGTVIMEVADLSELLAVAEVDETDIGPLAEGQPAEVRIKAYPDQVFKGVVSLVSLTTSNSSSGLDTSRNLRVEITLDPAGRRMKTGLTADIRIEAQRHPNVIKVPSQAVLGRRVDDLPAAIRDKNPQVDAKKVMATVVYRVIDGKAVITPVSVGASDATDTIITAGLDESDRVIAGPYKVLESLKHEQKVQDEREGAASKPASSSAPASRSEK
jgi:HlyD family secretion protein